MKRMALLLVVFLIVVGFAVSGTEALGQKAQAAKGKPGGGGNGNGNGSGDPEPNFVIQLTINDALTGAQLISDGKHRVAPDGELVTPEEAREYVHYQDYLLDEAAGMGIYPDPCATFEVSVNSSPGQARLRFSRRLADSSRCDLAPDNDGDARAFTLVFDKNDDGDAFDDSGGSCACDRLSYLAEVGDPLMPPMMAGGIRAKTGFVEDENGCTLSLAAGMIVWPNSDGVNDETAVPIITAWPFEDLQNSKKAQKRSGQSVDDKTSLSITFHTDVVVDTHESFWRLVSQVESIPVLVDPLDADVRTIASSGLPEELFDLTGPSHLFPSGGPAQCSDVSMTFEMSMRRINSNQ